MVLSNRLALNTQSESESESEFDSDSSAQASAPVVFSDDIVQPPTAYAIILPNGPGVVNLTAQHPHIRNIVRTVVPRLEAKLAAEDLFPDPITLSHTLHEELIAAAQEHGYTGLEQALHTMLNVGGPIGAIVCLFQSVHGMSADVDLAGQTAYEYLPRKYQETRRHPRYGVLSTQARVWAARQCSLRSPVVQLSVYLGCTFYLILLDSHVSDNVKSLI